jgi:DNA polymerase-3 subunit alpha
MGIVQSKQLKTTRNDATMAFVTLDDGSGSIEVVVFPRVLDKYKQLLFADNVVIIKGKISVREEEAPKIICDDVATPGASAEAPADAAQGGSEGGRKQTRYGLYIKVPSMESEGYKAAERLIEVFDGDFPLYVYLEKTGKLKAAPRRLWVTINDVLLGELRNILGNENVFIKNG